MSESPARERGRRRASTSQDDEREYRDRSVERNRHNRESRERERESRDRRHRSRSGSRRRHRRRSHSKSRSRSRSRRKGRSEAGDDGKRRKKRTGWDSPPPANSGAASMLRPEISSQLAFLQQQKSHCRIYVGSLDYSLTEADVHQVFGVFGTISNIEMPKEGARSKGFCFVEFTSPEMAEMAINSMQGFVLKGRTIKIGRPSAIKPPGGDAQLPFGGVSLGLNAMGSLGPAPNLGLPGGAEMNPAQAGALAAANLLAARCGAPPTLGAAAPAVPAGPPGGMPMGMGLGMGGMPGMPAMGMPGGGPSPPTVAQPQAPPDVRPPPSSDGPSPVIVLSNMVSPSEVDDDLEEEIRQECSKYGTVQDIRIRVEGTGVNIFVRFVDISHAGNAVPALHMRWFGGRQIHCRSYPLARFTANDFRI